MLSFLKDKFGIVASLSSLTRVVAWTKKVTRRVASQRQPLLRLLYSFKLAQLQFKSFPYVFLDGYGWEPNLRGVHHVVCQRCRVFARGAQNSNGVNMPFCLPCMTIINRADAAAEQRRQRETERERREIRRERREARRALWGSDYEEESDESETRRTSDEIYMDMIQAEADGYMNSPKAWSD